MARPKKDTQQIVCRVDCNVITKLKLINPSLLTQDAASGKLKFRHGALGKYIQRLIMEDTERREGQVQEDILEKFSG